MRLAASSSLPPSKPCNDLYLNGTGTPSAGGFFRPGQELYQKINHHMQSNIKEACPLATYTCIHLPLCCSLTDVIRGYFKQLQSHWLTFSHTQKGRRSDIVEPFCQWQKLANFQLVGISTPDDITRGI